jgi:competence protein ComEA
VPANEEIDLDLLNEARPGIAGSIDRVLSRLDQLRSRPEVVAFAAVIVVGIVVISLLSARRQPHVDVADLIPEIRLDTTTPSVAVSPDLLVHVSGAVVSPGVYELAAGARVLDAIDAAGGPTAEGLVHQLNLAAPLSDGVQVRVPVEGEVVAAPLNPANDPQATVNPNRGSASDLERLRGIGPSLAAAIVSHRDEHGPFGSVEALLDVPGIGPAKLEVLRDQVGFN